ncbi:PQQ-binding-like beta-propeller repeat protein [Streptomyces sp. NBC_00338]|uniref:outer membrane protein assembly factor BamB family protein n=1 Tax=Streptomyces sp. NBC_00338 TaxID=2975715 RepID=UPI0022540018|nr:PQQ-binding-like beta-propeller repeat protein [Streptomyces sp. NBC_00338]MCX5140812.1 PQQ-like beta-propeller repeat protein [Streptomyces sp. NBC_00338]
MSQPPGQQPPQGGFGAPYDPPPGAYPPAAGPYHQPGPYGQQPQPGYGYGYPPHMPPGQQPTGQQPPQPGGPRPGGLFRGRSGRVVGAALAVVLLAGGGIWYATGPDGGSGKPAAGGHSSAAPAPAPTGSGQQGTADGDSGISPDAEAEAVNEQLKPGESKVGWLQKGGVDLPRNGSDVFGPWIVGDTVVKAMYRTVSGYSVADGTRKWSLRLPATVCAAPSQATADGRIVLGIEGSTASDASCDNVQMVDLTTGRAGWRKEFVRTGAWDGLSDVAMAINGDTVTVGRTSRTDAFRVSDGKVVFGKLPGNCQPFGFASGPVAVAATSCQTAADDHKEQQVQRIDPATGKVRWTYKVKKGWQVDRFYSADPLVVSLKQPEKWAILVLNSDGTYRTQLSGGPGDYGPKCDDDLMTLGKNLDNCMGVAADANTFYLPTKVVPGKKGDRNKVVAFDLTTGKPRWTADSPVGQPVMPMRTEAGKLLMYAAPARNKGGAILSLPATGGTPRTVQRHPAAGSSMERGFFDPRVLYTGGRTLLMQTRISGITDGDEIEMRSMVAFGP